MTSKTKILGLPLILVVAVGGFFLFKKQIMAMIAKLKAPSSSALPGEG
ncbi:MAG: hypothetical protein ABIQ31_17890 [Ferruginibacter sp.]